MAPSGRRGGSIPPPAFAAEPHPVHFLLAFLAWIAGVVVATSLLTPPLFALFEGWRPGFVSFPRLLRRLAIPAALLLLWWILRRLEIRRWRQIGATGDGWRSGDALRAAAAGFAATLLLFGVELVAGSRVVEWEGTWWRPSLIVVAAIAIALREELVFRGAFLFPFGRLRGTGAILQALLVPGVYAAAHFARSQPKGIAVTWVAGFELWGALVRGAWGHPEAFTGLFALGLFLHLLARRQGHVWGAVGFHAGAVTAIQLGGDLTEGLNPRHTLFFADGLLPGWGAALVLGAACLLLLRPPARHRGSNSPERGPVPS
jgi:membrane protease YdiL (CAAX protease family)